MISLPTPLTINSVEKALQSNRTPFSYGVTVLITLNSPREKFWGAVLDINPAGISIRGLDLNSFDEVTHMLRTDEETVMPSTVFFPLNRVERIELDVANGAIPSLAERFLSKSGRAANDFLGIADAERGS